MSTAPVEFNQGQHVLESYKRNAAEQYSALLERIAFCEAGIAQRDLIIEQQQNRINELEADAGQDATEPATPPTPARKTPPRKRT